MLNRVRTSQRRSLCLFNVVKDASDQWVVRRNSTYTDKTEKKKKNIKLLISSGASGCIRNTAVHSEGIKWCNRYRI